MNDTQTITRGPLGKMEASFLAKAGTHPTFSLSFARQMLRHTKQDPTPQFLERLQSKDGSCSWKALDEKKLRSYAAKIGNSVVAKRFGFMMETLGLGDVEAFRKEAPFAPGFSPLDPTLPERGKYNRRWGLLVNAEMRP
jgi:hypothetical protein